MSTGSGRLWAVAVVVALPSFLFGWSISCLNPALKEGAKGSILPDISLTDLEKSIATSLTVAGAAIGCFVAGKPVERFGLRKVLLFNNLHFILGGVLCFLSNMGTLFAGRFFLGLGTGIECTIVPIILAEVSPPDARGKIGTIHQLFITLGILGSSLFAYALVTHVEHGWRYVQAFPVIPAVLQMLLASMVPESPRYLVKTGHAVAARTTLKELRAASSEHDISEAIHAIEEELAAEEHAAEVSWREVFYSGRAITIGLGLMFLQPMTGINAVIFYSTTIFKIAGVKEDILATVSVNALNVAMTFVSMALVDRLGRKTLLLISGALMCASLSVMGTVLLTLNEHEGAQGVLSIVSVLLYVVGFAIGFGAVCWVLIGETLANRVRNKAYPLFTAENWALNLVIGLCTLPAIEGLGGGSSDEQQKRGVAILFLIFAGMAGLATAFSTTLPETKGKSLDEVQQMLATKDTRRGSDVQPLAAGRLAHSSENVQGYHSAI